MDTLFRLWRKQVPLHQEILGMSASLFQHQEPKHFCGVIEGFCSLCVLPPGAGKKHWNVGIST